MNAATLDTMTRREQRASARRMASRARRWDRRQAWQAVKDGTAGHRVALVRI